MSGVKGNLNAFHRWFLELSRRHKRMILMPVDCVLVAVCFWLAIALRIGDWWPSSILARSWWMLLVLPAIGLTIFYGFGLYRFVLRSLGRHDIVAIGQACALLVLVLTGIAYFDTDMFLPRSTPIIFGLVVFLAMVGVRGAGRSYYHWLTDRDAEKKPVIVYGAGASGIQLVSALDAAREFQPVAFLDDDKGLQGSLIAGRRVHPPEKIDLLLERFDLKDVLLALPSISRSRRREIVEFLSQRSVRVQTI
ncbi:MAG: nucleoside-diphosphate sugar epimerase/dehydratase, partial [Rhodocyclaceae bacterium]